MAFDLRSLQVIPARPSQSLVLRRDPHCCTPFT
ncbi:hypothetical protein GBAR_LOCUS26558 [Geodia barretti]|uniref:Uncharacterized protein n=1 Tax=Geodia barretti TaxID=519541 RepID=A0AA35TI20_GEOBA|nr:hypothetical protein GBAR_LOCUS26558 [Geodia barretti]